MKHPWIPRILLLAADAILLELAFFAVYWWRFVTGLFVNPVSFSAAELLGPSLFVTVYWIALFAWFGLYRFNPLQARTQAARSAFKAAGAGALLLFILTFDPVQPLPSSRVILASYGAAIFLIVGGNRVGLLTVLREARMRGFGVLRTLLVGGESRARALVEHVRRHPELGLDIRAALCESRSASLSLDSIPVAGGFSGFRPALQSGAFDAVLFAPEERQERSLPRMLKILREFRVRVFISADQYRFLVGEVRPLLVHGHPLVDVRPEILSVTERVLKRVTDLILGGVMLLITLPLWMLLAVLIPLDSKGPVLYCQRRVGMNGRLFTMLKFRSMFRGAETETGAVLAVENDPRITRIGRFLRATRIDELPQLLNILAGQMSLVGPRPERVEFVQRFVKEIPLYQRRLNVKPGLTGWSQVNLRYDSRADQIAAKLQYDFFYIENISLPLDLKIMFMTLFVMLRGEGL
jgi:exopolysaccharide biosynthesis polyprenyl glycosylphosphotransferase